MSGISPITPTPVSFGCGNLDFISTLLLKSFQNDNKISTSFDLIPLYILNYSYTLLIIYLFITQIGNHVMFPFVQLLKFEAFEQLESL